jgi:hypothetical protein
VGRGGEAKRARQGWRPSTPGWGEPRAPGRGKPRAPGPREHEGEGGRPRRAKEGEGGGGGEGKESSPRREGARATPGRRPSVGRRRGKMSCTREREIVRWERERGVWGRGG